MDYNTVKQSIENVRKNITLAKRALSKNKEEQIAVRNSLMNTENNYQSKLRESKKEAFDLFISKRTKEVDDQILQLSEAISDENLEYEQKKTLLENANLRDFYTDESEILADVKASVEVLQRHLEKALSKRFKKELETQLDSGNIDMQSDNLNTLVDYFNKQSIYVSKLNKENKIDSIIEKVNCFCTENPFTISDDKQTAQLQMVGIIVVVSIFIIIMARVLFPFYFVFLALFGTYNLIKNYKIYSALIAHKAVKDNVNKIDENFRKEAEERLQQKRINLDNKHLETLADLESQLAKAKESLNNIKAKAEMEFKFDDSDARQAYDTAININTKKIDSLIAEEKATQEKLEDYYAELTRLNVEMDKVAGDIQSEYLNFSKVGTDIIFKPDFIFDVKNGKPVFFMHPQASCLFIYDDNTDIIDFIRLIAVQLRIKINPFNLNISIIDLQFMGLSFLAMQPTSDKKDDSLQKLFQIISSKDTLNKFLEEYGEELNRKLRSIRRQFPNIAEYNKFMVESDSLTEGYDFIFYQDPDTSYLQNEIVQKIINNGSTLGVFLHLFIQKDTFYELGDAAKELTSKIGKVYLLSDGNYHERAKDFVLENLIKTEN